MNRPVKYISFWHPVALGLSALAVFSVGFWWPIWYAARYHEDDLRAGGVMALAFVIAAIYALRAMASFGRWVSSRSALQSNDHTQA